MNFKPNLRIGQRITNSQIMDIFRCGSQGGMRRSLKTNTLVLVKHLGSKYYLDLREDKDGVILFEGMGEKENNSLNYIQNKTLANSNKNGVQVFLFQRDFARPPFEFLGRVLLADDPQDIHESNGYNNVIFPITLVKKELDITTFLLQFSINELIKKEILVSKTFMFSEKGVKGLISLMKENEIDTLTSPGGWYLTQKGIFFNRYSSGKKIGEYLDLINKNLITIDDVLHKQDIYINPYFKNSLVYNSSILKNNDITPGVDINITEKKSSIFRLNSLSFDSNTLSMPINFINVSNPESNKDDFYTSFLIGPNGTGKSLIISLVQKILSDTYRLLVSRNPELPKDLDYELNYFMGEDDYQISQNKGKISYLKNKKRISIKELKLPEKVISCSYTLQDRFSMFHEGEEELIKQYEYLGIRNYIKSNNVKSFSSVVASNIMLASLTDNILLSNLKNITSFLEFEPVIRIEFKTKGNEEIEDIFTKSFIVNAQRKAQVDNPNIELIFADEIEDLIKEMNKVRLPNLFNEEDSFEEIFYLAENRLIINFDLESTEKYETFYDTFKSVWHLLDIGLLKPPTIYLKKLTRWFSIEESSSGEYQYLSTMVNILTKITPNSLVILDEPETSLHPTWQYRYMSELNKIFKDFFSCHFLIASHSHFMVSDLKPSSSTILTMTKNDDNQVTVEMLHEETYGRSAEDILYNVFNLPTTRNYYLGTDLDEILMAISFNEISIDIRKKVKKLIEINKFLKDSDPLKKVINKIVKKVESSNEKNKTN